MASSVGMKRPVSALLAFSTVFDILSSCSFQAFVKTHRRSSG